MDASVKVIEFNSLDSTSDEAVRQIKQGQKPPFIVTANSQTKGRGRIGNSWQSPVGNLYATFVTTPTQITPHMSLTVAADVCRTLSSLTQLSFRIKWPNDILFAGRKVAGILCESMSYDGVAYLVCGVGINGLITPEADNDHKPLSLADLGFYLDAETLLKKLIFYLFTSSIDDVRQYLIPQGFPVVNPQGGLDFLSDIADDGVLHLEQKGPLVSAHDAPKWFYQGPFDLKPLLLFDCGNTAIKAAYFTSSCSPEPASVQRFIDDEVGSLSQALTSWLADMPAHHIGFCAGVNPNKLHILKEALRSHEMRLVPLPKKGVYFQRSQYDGKQLGIDRLCLIEGVMARKLLQKDLTMIVSLGTATTIDVLDDSGMHLGGQILPGIATSLMALKSAGALLKNYPEHKPFAIAHHLGLGTEEAMQLGILQMTVGAIAESSRVAMAGRKLHVHMIVTGGYADAVLPSIQALHPEWEITHIPHLLFYGMQSLALLGVMF